MIEPIEEEVIKHSEESLEHEEEDAKKEPQPTEVTVHALAGYSNPQTMKVGGLLKQQPITVLIDTGSTNNFLNSKVAVHMNLPIENCSRFVAKVANGRILKCDHRCPQVKLLLQDQEIIADFFLVPLDDHEAILRIKWLTILGDVFLNFMQLIMKFYSKEKQVVLHGKREGDVTTICTQQMEKVLHKACSRFFIQLEQQTKGEPIQFEDPNLLPLLAEFSDIFDELYNLPLTRRHDHYIMILSGKPSANTQPYQYPHL